MSLIKSAILVILSALLFLAAVCFVFGGLLSLDNQFATSFIRVVTRPIMPPPYYLAAGFVLLVASIVVYNLSGDRSDSTAIYTFQGERGPIDISLRALEDYISKNFAQRPVVNTIRTRVGTSKDRQKLRVRATISVWSEQSLKEAGEAVQREITRCLKDGLGLDNVESVLVSVDKIIASKSPRRAVSEQPLTETESLLSESEPETKES